MKRYILRIRTGPTFNDMAFTANSLADAQYIAEAQFGSGCVLGFISEDYI